MSAAIQVYGLEAIEQKLIALESIGGKPNRVLNAAGRRAWKPTLEYAKNMLLQQRAYRTGMLYVDLMITVKKRMTFGTVHLSGLKIKMDPQFVAGIKGLVNPRRYWHLVEFGAPNRGIRPRRYIRAAMDACGADMVREFAKELEVAVDKALSKGIGATP